ncbi:hypothetical protein ACIBAG_27580 [Streptomyces sp. NPDC051243]|uniref:hypothetical protein n=1 Tax=Streptomyces sp. NPDC051243 TaxID=3365646 RepID=UPI00378BC021
MGSRADDEGTDVEIYRKPLTDTVHADTPTGAPEQLLALLDQLGFERNTVRPAGSSGPTYVWHEAPAHLGEEEKKQLASRAVPALLMAGYVVHIPDYLFDPVAYRSAAAQISAQRAAPAAPAPATGTPSRARGSRRAG